MMPPAREPPATESDLVVTLERDGRRCTVSATDLAKLYGAPILRVRLLAILYARTSSGLSTAAVGKEGVRGSDGAVSPQETERERNEITNSRFVRGSDGGAGEEKPSLSPGHGRSSLQLASYLADRLGDWKSIRWYQWVAAEAPPEAIQDALVRALDLAPGDVRRSRAAYFTSLIRPFLRPRNSPRP